MGAHQFSLSNVQKVGLKQHHFIRLSVMGGHLSKFDFLWTKLSINVVNVCNISLYSCLCIQ